MCFTCILMDDYQFMTSNDSTGYSGKYNVLLVIHVHV